MGSPHPPRKQRRGKMTSLLAKIEQTDSIRSDPKKDSRGKSRSS